MKRAVLLAISVIAVGCKKEEPKPATPVVTAEAVAPKPPPPPEPRAAAECAAPITASAKRTFQTADAHPPFTVGVLGPINEDSGANLLTLKKYLKFFADEKADAIVVTGDVGEVADGISRALKVVAGSKIPVLVIAGNRECRDEYAQGVAAVAKEFDNVIDMNQTRAVEFPELTLVSLPGYHDPNYINCANGCRYFKSTVDEVIALAKESKSPSLLVSHGPPRGEGTQALDYASVGGNVGDEDIARALRDGNIAFGAFSNIKEAGGRATDISGSALIKPETWVKTLYLNPGPADTVGWELNDNTQSNGMAAVIRVKGTEASWKGYRAKPLTAAEKAQAKQLDPPARPEPTAAAEGDAPAEKTAEMPKPPPGQPERPAHP